MCARHYNLGVVWGVSKKRIKSHANACHTQVIMGFVNVSLNACCLLSLGRSIKGNFPLRVPAALAPRRRVNLTRFHGVFPTKSKYIALVTSAKTKPRPLMKRKINLLRTPCGHDMGAATEPGVQQQLPACGDTDIETCLDTVRGFRS